MTRDEIIRMAREADIDWHKNWNDDGSNRLEHLAALIAALVAAAEREACAELCLAQRNKIVISHPARVDYDPDNFMAMKCAAAIRARGKA